MRNITVINEKRLSQSEWTSIFGTEMHQTMLLNRVVVRNETFVILLDWLKSHCKSSYYVHGLGDTDLETRVYILNDEDVVYFKMNFS